MISFFINLIFRLPENPFKRAIRNIYYADVISERLVEYPLVFQNLQIERGRILDIGCYYSALPVQLASMGFRVYGIDPEPYQLTHPNFTFVQGDIMNNNFKEGFFDVVTTVSTLEHIGLGFYADQKEKNGDKKAIKEVARILKPKGKLILTVPYSKEFKVTSSQRMYDKKSLEKLMNPEFKILKKRIFKNNKGKWEPAREAEVIVVKGERTQVMTLIVAEKG